MASIERTFSLNECKKEAAKLRNSYNDLYNNSIGELSVFISSYNNWYIVVHKVAGPLIDIAVSIATSYYNAMLDGIYNHWAAIENGEDIIQSGSGITVKIKFYYEITLNLQIPTSSKIIGYQKSNGSWVTIQ